MNGVAGENEPPARDESRLTGAENGREDLRVSQEWRKDGDGQGGEGETSKQGMPATRSAERLRPTTGIGSSARLRGGSAVGRLARPHRNDGGAGGGALW